MSDHEPPTVRQLLRLDVLAGHELAAGEHGLDRPVRDVVVAPASGLATIPPGALLLVAPRLGTDFQIELLIRQVHTARGTALLLTGGPRVMVSTRHVADRVGVPLLLVPAGDPLRLAAELARHVHAPQTLAQPLIDRVLQRLRTPLASLPALVALLASEIGGPVAVRTAEGAALAGDPSLELPAPVLERPQPQSRTVDGGHVLSVPIYVEEPAHPDLWLLARLPPSHAAWVEASLSALRVVALAVGSWATRERLDGERNARDRSSLLSELLDNPGALSRHAVGRAVQAGWRLDGWHVGIYLRTAEGGSAVRLTPTVRRVLEGRGLVGPVVEQSDGWAAWTTSGREPPSHSYREVADRLRQALEDVKESVDAVAGVGRPYLGPTGIATSLKEAREASLFAGRGRRNDRVEHIDELGVRRVLADWHRSDAFRAYAHNLLQPLLAGTDDQLLETLRTYLELESSTSSTAAALRIHRNTVSLRLARVEQLLGMTLTRADERLVLQLACRVVQDTDPAPTP